MDPTCGLADKIRDLVRDLIWKHLLYLVHYRKNIEQLNGQLDDLNRERTSLQHRVDEATNNTNKIEENVLHWLHEVDKIIEQVHKLHEESEAKLECGITSCPNPWLRYKLSKRAETIAQKAVKIYEKRNFNTVSYRVPPQSMPESTNRESNKRIDSRVGIKNQIMEALRNSRFNMIGLCGLGGVGKTTIARDIEKEEKNQKVFEKVIMATASKEMNIGQIQDQIIEKLGMELNERTEEVKASRLYERLKDTKNMLLILDDLWQELDWGKVGIPFVDVERYSKINEGCKILLTSRKETLLSKSMKCQKIITMGVLSNDEAWELFQSIAELSIKSSNPDFKSIANEIVQKCGGLPLAIATAAKTLKDKNIAGWRDFLLRLKQPLSRSVTGIKEVDKILKLSYEDLSQENQYIFLLSAMLSHNSSIEDLLVYSVGLDILKHTQNMGDAHDAIFEIVGMLKSLNLFLDSFSSHRFTMHDVFRDFALSIAPEKLNVDIVSQSRLNEWPDEIDLERRKGICLQESEICELPEELHGPILDLFLLNSKKSDFTIPNMFFKSSKELKVLAITNVNFSSLPSLSFLHRLKALCLHSCLLEDITEIRSLRKLKVLSLAYSEIQRLPVEVAELTSLQMLNLSYCSKIKVIPPKILARLKKLEVLYMGNSFNQWKVEESSKADENASLGELMDLPISSLEIHIPNLSMLPENLFLMMNLRRYRIFIGERWTRWQSNYQDSKILKLELESSIDLTAGLQNLSKGVEDLHLYGSNGQENVLYNRDASGFPCLRRLRIESNDDIKYIEDAFPILESLELKNLKALENLCEGPNDIVFGQLHTLKMENLPALTGDFSIKDRATKNTFKKNFKSLFNKVLLPKLEILKLSNLNNLIPLIWNDQLLPNSFSNLKILKVEKCGFVKLVPLHVLKSLNNLEEVEVISCDMLEIVFDFEDLNYYYKEMESSKVVVPLKKLKLRNLSKLKNVWSNNCQGNVSFPSLRSIYVDDRVSLTSIFLVSIAKVLLSKLEILELSNLNSLIPMIWDDQILHNSFNNLKIVTVQKCGFVKLVPFHVLKSLNNLEELDVEDCDMLEKVFDFEDLNDYYKEMNSSSVVVPLKMLKLWNLPKLKNVWSDHYQGNASFRSLRSVHVYKCESLTSIFHASIAKDMLGDLQELEIRQCGVDVIVAKGQVSESVPVTFGFPRLTSLLLSGLPNLRNFYPQKHTLECLHLNQLSIECCDKLRIFEKEVSGSSEIYEEENMLDSKYPLLPRNKVIGNLERLKLQGKEVEKVGNGQFLMYHFPKLKQLHLSFEKEPSHTFWKRSPNLGKLKLSGNFKKALGGDNVAALAGRFPKLTLEKISIMGSLSPSLVSLPNLTHLNVKWCNGTTLMTSSIAQSLVHITHLSISHCSQIGEIITKQEGEDDQDKEIFFRKLEYLELTNLPRLMRFCRHNYTFRFPLLDKLVITRCPKFKRFSPGLITTPSLKSVQLSQNWGDRHEIFDTNLNKTFYHQRFMVSREVVLDEDDAIMIRNDQFPTDRYPQVEILGIGGFAEEWVTFPYTLLEIFPKLNELHVKNSSFGEIFPSHAPFSTSFLNLTLLKVFQCHQLVYLMTISTAKSLVNLETLEMDDCERLEEIIKKELNEDVEEVITLFRGLRILKLRRLPKLKTQEDKKDFNIEDRATNTGCTNILISLFSHDKVLLPKLERLELSWLSNNFISLIWDDQLLHNSFNNLKTLIFGSCDFMKMVPLRVMKYLNNLKKLEVSYCHKLEMVFGFEDLIDYQNEMESSSVVVPLSLTHLEVKWCRGLTTLMTSSATPSLVHLTHLSISFCDQVKEIITKQKGEDDEDREIIFRKLEFLELIYLPKLRRFCRHNYTFRFPLLDKLVITRCLKFNRFSPGLITTPSLKSVQLSPDWGDRHEIFDTNLNKTFYHQRFVTSREVVLDEDDAIMIRDEPFPADCCPKVEILGIEGFVDGWVTFPYTLLERFPKLYALHVEDCSFEEIFPSHVPSSTSFYNLTVLKVSRCHHLVYLVTCSTVKSLVNLEILEMDECEKMEEIIRNDTNEDVERGITFNGLRILKLTRLPKLKTQEDKKDFNIEDRATNTECTNISRSLFSHNKVLLPKLERLELSYLLNNLISLIWDDQFSHNSFSNLKTLIVQNCDFMKLVPLRMLKSLNNLEKLEVSYCHKLEMVFGFEDLNDYYKEMASPSVFVPLSLTHLEVEGCCGLTNLMTSSAAPSLVHITHLSISNCDQIEEIIMKKEGEDDEDREIIFNQMKFLEFDNLPRLKRFCGFNYNFRFPLLEHVTITKCPRLTMFCPEAIHAPQLQSVQVDKYEPDAHIWMTDINNTIQHLFTFEEVISTTQSMAINGKNITKIVDVFPNVSSLYIESFTDEGVTFPLSSLGKFPKLDELHVEHCSFEEIFPSQDQIIDIKGKIPSSASFQNLRSLFISGCHQLIHLVTTSTAKSLVSLRWLQINDCKRMEEIVMNDTNEDVQGGLTFNQLWEIKLTDMPSLKMFSPQSHTFEFPQLEKIEISGCAEMKKFCPGVLKTPKLSKVKIEEHGMEWKDEEDLNKTMEGLSSAKDSINI